jgi:hypothetical protein
LARSTATRAVGLAAIGGIATLGLGGFGTAADAAPRPSSAPVVTSVSFDVNLRVTMPGQYATTLRARGKTDFVHHALTATVTLPAVGLHASADGLGSLPGDKPLTLAAIWVDGRAYVTVPPSLAALAGGAKVLSVPVSGSDAGKVATAFTQSSVALSYTRLLMSELVQPDQQHRVAARTIGGVRATGTRADLTLAQLLKLVPGLSPSMSGDIKALAGVTIPVTVWVDRSGRLVEVALSPSSSPSGSISGTVSFSDYDAKVDIAAPAAGTVKTAPASVQQMLGGLDLFGVTPFA